MSTLAIQPITADAAFLDDLNAARREALAVLRNVLASLIPKPGSPPPASLALLREARLAACDVLALKLPAAPVSVCPPAAPPTRVPLVPLRGDPALFVPSGFGPMRSAQAIGVGAPATSPQHPGADATTLPIPGHAPKPLTRSRASTPVQALLSRLGAPP